jgi:hypothetical protein
MNQLQPGNCVEFSLEEILKTAEASLIGQQDENTDKN